jgi:hypothetical protein
MGEAMSRDGFLERWSRRKLAEGKEPETETETEAEAEQPAEETAPVDEPDAEGLDEEDSTRKNWRSCRRWSPLPSRRTWRRSCARACRRR